MRNAVSSRVVLMGLLAIVALFTVQCGASDETVDEGQACTASIDCPPGESCNLDSGVCLADSNGLICNTDADCGPQYVCRPTTTGTNKCIPGFEDDNADGDSIEGTPCPDGVTCESPELYFCCNSLCTAKFPQCFVDDDCYEGQSCDTVVTFSCANEPASCNKNSEIVPDGEEDGDEEDIEPECSEDDPCTAEGSMCCDGECVENFPSCTTDDDCWVGQTCDVGGTDLCVGEATGCTKNGAEDGDTDNDTPDGDQPDGEVACTTDNDCPATQHCEEGPACVDDCTTDEDCAYKPGSACNTNNGRCEYCTTVCPATQCCNYNGDFWYCGQCCQPPCPSGQACQSSSCVELKCPDPDDPLNHGCDDCYDCSAETGFICKRDPDACHGGTDGDVETRSEICLPANASCTEGVDDCCSGSCLMGTCL